MASGTVLVLMLAASFQTSMSQQLSTGGCACKSGCDKSWLHSGSPWCYVDSGCKATGWDSCQDAAMLYASAIKEKSYLEEVEKAGADLKTQLATATRQLTFSESSMASLQQKLAETSAKEATAQKRAEKAEHTLEDVQRKDEAKIKDISQKLLQSLKAHSDKIDAKEAKMNMVEKKLAEAESLKSQNTVTIKVMQQKIMQAEDDQAEAAVKSDESAKKISQAEAKTKEAEAKLQQASKSQSDMLAKLGEAQRQIKDGELKHKEEQSKLAKQVQGYLSMAKEQEVATLKLKATTKTQLENAHQKQVEAEKKVEQMELAEILLRKQLHEVNHVLEDTKSKHAETSQKLHEAVEAKLQTEDKLHEATDKMKEAKLHAKLYKIFKDSNSQVKSPRLRASHATPLDKMYKAELGHM